jgi:competence protein ComEC
MAAPRAAAILALSAALGYAALAGFAVPTQRALIMLAVVLGGMLARRHVRPTHALSAALLAVLAWDPTAVLAPGFWLSFAAVAVLFATALPRAAVDPWWRRACRSQLAIAVGLLPLVVLFFQQASLVAPAANLVAVPLVGTLVVPLTLTGTVVAPWIPAIGQGLLEAAAWLLSWVLSLLGWLAGFEWASVSLGAVSAVGWVTALAGAGLALAPRGWPARWLAAPLLAPLLLARYPAPGAGEVWLTALDVGQGLAVVVRTQQHTLVYDTGARFSGSFDAGRAVVVPYLRHAGVGSVDTLVVSHGDNDHIGGARSLLAALPVSRVLSAATDKLVEAQPCLAGERWSWDGVEFEILHPSASETLRRENDTSCVLRVVSPHGSALLTGDIERGAESQLVRTYDQALAADIMTAPHHGSRTSSSAAFVAAVQPQHVVVPAGYANRYGFPHEEVAARYELSGAKLWNTGSMGALTFRIAEHAAMVPTRQRDVAKRYWHRL